MTSTKMEKDPPQKNERRLQKNENGRRPQKNEMEDDLKSNSFSLLLITPQNTHKKSNCHYLVNFQLWSNSASRVLPN